MKLKINKFKMELVYEKHIYILINKVFATTFVIVIHKRFLLKNLLRYLKKIVRKKKEKKKV